MKENELPVTVIAHLTINDDAPEALAGYFKVTEPLLKKAGAVIKNRFTMGEIVVGKKPASSVVFVEYPDRASVDLVFESDEYKSIKDVRDKAFLDYYINIVAE